MPELIEQIVRINRLYNELTHYKYAYYIDWEYEDFEIVRFHFGKWIILTKSQRYITNEELNELESMLKFVAAWWNWDCSYMY
jgi:hypothetical protein